MFERLFYRVDQFGSGRALLVAPPAVAETGLAELAVTSARWRYLPISCSAALADAVNAAYCSVLIRRLYTVGTASPFHDGVTQYLLEMFTRRTRWTMPSREAVDVCRLLIPTSPPQRRSRRVSGGSASLPMLRTPAPEIAWCFIPCRRILGRHGLSRDREVALGCKSLTLGHVQRSRRSASTAGRSTDECRDFRSSLFEYALGIAAHLRAIPGWGAEVTCMTTSRGVLLPRQPRCRK